MTRAGMVPEVIAERLRQETGLIHEYAASGSTWRSKSQPFDSLGDRLRLLRGSGLLYTGAKGELDVTNKLLVDLQAEIASVHGLVYFRNKAQSRWTVDDTDVGISDKPAAGRSKNYISELLSSSVKYAIPKVDLALIAHAFKLPAAVLEADNITTVEEAIERVRYGSDLFAQGLDFLREVQDRKSLLIIEDLPSWRKRHVTGLPPRDDLRGIKIRNSFIPPSSLPVNTPFALFADLRSHFQHAYTVVAINTDPAGATSLISIPALMDHDFWQEAPLTVPPAQVIQAGQLDVSFDSVGVHTVSVIASTDDLSRLPSIGRASRVDTPEVSTTSALNNEDLADIRDFLLRRSASRWVVLQASVNVE